MSRTADELVEAFFNYPRETQLLIMKELKIRYPELYDRQYPEGEGPDVERWLREG